MGVRTAEDLSDRLAEDLIWRRREVTDLRKLVTGSQGRSAPVLTRALIAIVYAHWEGYLKRAAGSYLDYLNVRRLKYADLTPNLLALATRARFREASKRRNPTDLIRIIVDLQSDSQSPVTFSSGDLDIGANLSSNILHNLTATLGIGYEPYETKGFLIDQRLLKSRNSIAHGEDLVVTAEDAVHLSKDIDALMVSFRTGIENAVALGSYRRERVG